MRLATWLLRAVLSRDRAAAVLGDLAEELAERAAAGRRPRLPRAWLLAHTSAAVLGAIGAAVPLAIRRGHQLLRDAGRGLRASPGTSLAAIAIFALGIAAATVTFSVVDHVILRPLPFDRGDRLVVMEGSTPITPRQRSVSGADYHAWVRGTTAFESLAMWESMGAFSVQRGDATVPVVGHRSTSNLFDLLRARPLFGRVYGPEHEVAGRDQVVVISYEFWQRYFGGAADVVGQAVPTRTGKLEVLGVMPRGFAFPIDAASRVDLWCPYVPQPDDAINGNERFIGKYVVGRLRDGVSLDEARAGVERASSRQAETHPSAYRDWNVRVMTLQDATVGAARDWMLLVLGAVGIVMVIACVNVANLLLSRAVVRGRDFAVRAALGAGRRQLASVLVVEGMALAAVAAGIGLMAARWGIGIARAALPADLARTSGIALDTRVFVAAVVAAAVTGLAASLVPAWQASRTDLVDSLKDGGAVTIRPARRRWRSLFLVAEMAFVVVLLVASTLVVTSFVRVMGVDLGFERANLLSVRPSPFFNVPPAQRAARNAAFFDRALIAVRAVPGVAQVALMTGGDMPLGHNLPFGMMARLPDGRSVNTGAEMRTVTHEYFDTMGSRLLAGRLFDARDTPGAPSVLVIDDLSARRLFNGVADAVGRIIQLPPTGPYSVIGVVGNAHHARYESATTPQFYMSLIQKPYPGGSHYLVMRTSVPASRVAPAIDTAIAALLPPGTRRQPVINLDDRFRDLTADRRFSAGLMALLGVLALVIGAAGVYGVMVSIVSQQTRDIGIRMALGATKRHILSRTVADASRHLATGALIGLGAGWAVSNLFTSLLFGVTRTDPRVYAVVLAVLFVVGLAAALLPARRAARVDPVSALR